MKSVLATKTKRKANLCSTPKSKGKRNFMLEKKIDINQNALLKSSQCSSVKKKNAKYAQQIAPILSKYLLFILRFIVHLSSVQIYFYKQKELSRAFYLVVNYDGAPTNSKHTLEEERFPL